MSTFVRCILVLSRFLSEGEVGALNGTFHTGNPLCSDGAVRLFVLFDLVGKPLRKALGVLGSERVCVGVLSGEKCKGKKFLTKSARDIVQKLFRRF